MTTVELGDPAHDPQTPPFADPQHLGDDRPDNEPGPLAKLLALPHEWLNLAHVIEDARNVLVDAMAREPWANTAPLSNATQTGTVGGNAYAYVGLGHSSAAVQLRDILIGLSAAATVQIVAVRGLALVGSLQGQRVIGTVRITATTLNAWFPPVVRLEAEENLFLLSNIATASFDFSASYRVLKG